VRVLLVDNPRSWRGRYPVARVRPILEAAGWRIDVAHRSLGTTMRQLISRVGADGLEIVVAAGGDGTLRDVATALASDPLELGILPGGTANVFAHELGIPIEPESAATALLEARPRDIDVGRLILPDGHATRFLISAGFGLDGAIMAATDNRLKRRVGPLAILLAGLATVPRREAFEVEVRVDGQTCWHGRAIQVLAGNTRRYANLVEPTPEARLDDGLLDLLVIPEMALSRLAAFAAYFVREGRPDPGASVTIRAPRIELRFDRQVDIQLDGSPLGRRLQARLGIIGAVDFHLEAEAAAIRLRVPRDYAGPLLDHRGG
jgi:YegS/Rv2252/BmrU family lipid kinase